MGEFLERTTSRPPMRSTMQKLKKDLDFKSVLATFNRCEPIQNNRLKLEQASALASRLIARRAHSFRVQPSFMYFRKMNIALCRLKELNIYEDIKDTREAISVAETARKLDDKYYLPTQDNFVYFLIKFQSFAKLLIRIVMCARESHRLFLELLHRAAFVEIISLFISVLAEIWTICIEMCKATVQFYNEFRRHFLKNYEQIKKLPKHLDRWLGEEYNEYIDITVDSTTLKTDADFILFNETDIDTKGMIIEQKFEPKLMVAQRMAGNSKAAANEDSTSSILKGKGVSIKSQDLLEKRQFKIEKAAIQSAPVAKSTITMKQMPLNIKMETLDLGAKISRDNPSMPERKLLNVKQINVEQLKTVKEIREFLSVEDELRQANQHKNSKGINNNDWDKFKIASNQILILGHPGLVLKKFKTLWQKLCKNRRK